MSTTTMRHYDATLAFVPLRGARRAERARRRMRLRLSRRKFRQLTRTVLSRA